MWPMRLSKGYIYEIVLFIAFILENIFNFSSCSIRNRTWQTFMAQDSVEPSLCSGFYIEPFGLLNHIETS